MKRWLLFSGLDFYPQGGAKDYTGEYDTSADAYDAVLRLKNHRDWFTLLDTETGAMTHISVGAVAIKLDPEVVLSGEKDEMCW